MVAVGRVLRAGKQETEPQAGVTYIASVPESRRRGRKRRRREMGLGQENGCVCWCVSRPSEDADSSPRDRDVVLKQPVPAGGEEIKGPHTQGARTRSGSSPAAPSLGTPTTGIRLCKQAAARTKKILKQRSGEASGPILKC